LFVAACSDAQNQTSTGTGGASTGNGGAGGSGGIVDPCPAPFVGKGPWVLGVDESRAKVRFEACEKDVSGDVHFTKEGGGAEQTATSAVKPVTLTETYTAVLNSSAVPDYAGTYYMHEAALSNLEKGTCYSYFLGADPNRKGRFCTARPSGDSFSFMALGDTNPGLGHTEGVVARGLAEKPELTIHGGDIQYYDSGLETWAFWFDKMQPMLSRGAFFPAIGNHEAEKSDELSDYALRFFGGAGFNGGETFYRFQTGGVHFFSLNTEESIGQGSAQATWLESNLVDAASLPGYRFSVVYFHRPLVTCGDKGDDLPARDFLEPIFLANKVAVVLQAHMHGYERFEFDNGITYITAAGGGGTLGDIDENASKPYCDKRVSRAAAFHSVVFQVAPGMLGGKVIEESGEIIDSFTKVVP